jgi:hypothetical protein
MIQLSEKSLRFLDGVLVLLNLIKQGVAASFTAWTKVDPRHRPT